MAPCGAMDPNRRGGAAIWTPTLWIKLLAAISTLLLVAGSSTVVGVRAIVAAPPPGSPIVWGPCKNSVGHTQIPAGAECGMLSVPVDYSKPDGEVARIALIRFKAAGEKIGSLIRNPGGPGESGIEAAASMAATVPQSIQDRFDLVGFDPRGV